MRTKRRSLSHIIDKQATTIFSTYIPDYWVIREYKPDYGIDFSVELFEPSGIDVYDTLGEHLFIQLKGKKALSQTTYKIKHHINVEKWSMPPKVATNEPSTPLEAISISIDVPELATIQRMGAAVPVILIVIDVLTEDAFFLCLNDYIDKVLIVDDPNWHLPGNKKIYIPVSNRITADPISLEPLKFYAKRAKLYAAFQKFSYQHNELSYTSDSELSLLANNFANILLRYDFWLKCDYWPVLKIMHGYLRNFIDTGDPQMVQWDDGFDPQTADQSLLEWHKVTEIRSLWKKLASLASLYEEIVRETNLPTGISSVM